MGAMTKNVAPAKAIEIREVMFSSLPGDPYLDIERAGMESIINDFVGWAKSPTWCGGLAAGRAG
jgi:hypothetical protein